MTPDDSGRGRTARGERYRAGAPRLAADRQAVRRLAAQYSRTGPADPEAARPLLERLLGGLGPGAETLARLHRAYGCNIRVGARSFVNRDQPDGVVARQPVPRHPHPPTRIRAVRRGTPTPRRGARNGCAPP